MLLFVTNKKYFEQHQNVFPKLFYFFMILGNHESLKLDIFQKKVLSKIPLLSKHLIWMIIKIKTYTVMNASPKSWD